MDLSRLEEIYHACAGLSPEARERLLADRCGDDPELRAKLQEVLAHSDAETDPSARFTGRAGQDPSSLIGRKLGRYTIERLVDSGGMGSVFTAQQDGTKRRVALKIVRPELLDASVLRRFSLEVEALGRLQHPNIAQVHDGGRESLFSSTIPYFAMEYVENARPIDAYVQERGLDVDATLALFSDVCSAISHAHRKGVIHRDLKPANILVDAGAEHPAPKVIDFGIARFSGESAGTTLTSAGQVLGTLETMAPEQVGGAQEEIDVRTDVYALGAVLHGMLTGRPPLPLRGTPVPEALRRILETEPEPPSAHRRGIRPELDAIVARCLAKDPERRYESVKALLEDVAAFREGRPVSARPPTTTDQLRVAWRRHRRIVLPAAAILVVAVVGALVSTRFALESHRRSGELSRLAYRASVNAAAAALRRGETVVAERLLEECPPEQRDWVWRHLSGRLPRPRAAFPVSGPGQNALHPEFDAAGRHLATATSRGSTLHVWDAESGARVIAAPVGGPIWWFCFHEDRLLVHVPDETRSRLVTVDLREGVTAERDAARMLGMEEGGYMAGFSPAEGGLIARASGREILLFRVADGQLLMQDDTGRDSIWGAFDRAGRLMVTPGGSGESHPILVYDVRARRRLRELTGLRHLCADVAVDAAGTRVAAGSIDGQVLVWDLSASGPEPVQAFDAGGGRVFQVEMSDDGSLLAVATGDKTLRVWDLASGERLAFQQFHFQPVLAFRPGTRSLYTMAGEGVVEVWEHEPADRAVAVRHASYVYPVEVAERAGAILSGGWDGYVGEAGCLRWTDLPTGALRRSWGIPGTTVLAAVLSPDETEAVASVFNDGAATGKGDAFSAGPDEGLVLRLDLETGEVRSRYPAPSTLLDLAADPAWTRMATTDRTGTLRVVDLRTGAVLFESAPQFAPFADRGAVAWSPDGSWIAVAGGHDRIRILDGDTYELRSESGGHADKVWSATFGPEGNVLLTASEDRTVRVWSVPDGRLLATLVGHGGGVLCAKVSPDGSRIVSAGRGGEVRFWRRDSLEPVASLVLHDSYVYDLEWADEGNTLVTGSGDGTVRVWRGE